MRHVGVLISGRGSNLQALIDAAQSGELGGRIAVVVSNVRDAPGLARASRAGIPTVTLADHTRETRDGEILSVLRRHEVDLVCLAGYMRLLTPPLLRAFPGSILNVHPSLLPAFPGLHAQRQAWEYGVKVSGATVHLVDEGLDSGPIVLQEAVKVEDGDTVDELTARILVAEHRLYPRAVRMLLAGEIRVAGRRMVRATRESQH